MKMFIVKVGKYSRKGNFIEYLTRAVSVSDDYFESNLYVYFRDLYDGLDVKIFEAKPFEDITPQLPPRRANTDDGYIGKLSGFKIKYTEDEKLLFNEHIALTKQAREKLEYLEDSIRARYKKLSYCHGGMDLETSMDGTFCTSLPIKSDDFFRLVKEGADESERLIITAPATADDNDLPF